MSKIKVVHHSKTVGYSGTDRTAQLFCKYLAQSERFEPYIVYRLGDPNNQRLDIVREWLGDDHVIGYEWEPGKKGRVSPFMPEHDNLHEVLSAIDPDIVHVHRSGYAEWPCFRYMAPRAKWVETNIFGKADRTPEQQIDLNVYISDYIRGRALQDGNNDGPVLYNPIEQPVLDITPENKELCREELLTQFKIPHDAILLGRVGRADNFDPISLRAFAEVEKVCPEAWYIVINPCQGWHDEVARLGIQNIRFGGPIVDDAELSNFYRGLDIYAHARHDGECCPCNIQEAMMHRLPVVSHESAIYNGQSEIIGNAGFVVPVGAHEAYRDVLVQLIANPELANEDESGLVRIREHFGLEARRRAMRYFEAECMTSQLAQFYDWVLKNG
ncbi:MAG: glycosyltransferase family 4 protein [Hydrogenophaga sp.]|uniref:glycosyltransferase family 4 protein n=1 Tax=Hydrogenophaga sp. TaxID=1904254 RepID=UPI00260E4A76|nr:glycosyltransferase family 4 protein [Hydrogenophaga sp.]MCV0439775.1 glycosyltransferase family 4 protein [Hydrogenophaga sp.]